jgi:hypothetical protein
VQSLGLKRLHEAHFFRPDIRLSNIQHPGDVNLNAGFELSLSSAAKMNELLQECDGKTLDNS